MTLVEEATVPGAFLVEYIPIRVYSHSSFTYMLTELLLGLVYIVKHIPRWFPFASFKRYAEDGRKQIHDFVEGPFLRVKEDLVSTSSLRYDIAAIYAQC